MAAIAAALWLAVMTASPPAAQPVALVVGNADHLHLPDVPSAHDDARAVAERLRDAGFGVTLLTDVSLPVLRATVQALGQTGDRDRPAVLYFAGHAITLGAANRLVPAEAQLSQAAALADETLALSEVTDAFAGRPLVMWIDAARPSPVAAAARRLGVGAGGMVPVDPPPGGAVILAAEPGAIAPVPDGAGGALAAALVAHLGRPGQRLDALVQQVVVVVSAASAGRQVPWARIAPGAEALQLVQPAAAAPVFEIVGSETILNPTDDVPAVAPPPPAEPALPTFAALPSPTATPPDTAALPPVPDDLPRAVQAELRRMGFYCQAVDGDWGPGSRRALARFHEARGTPPPDPADPTEAVWRGLLEEPDGACPVAAPAPPRAATGTAAPRRQDSTGRRDPVCTFTGSAVVCR
ncbi:MAG: hypothetical protein KF887_15125 [Paracoccaceae bacterium]|nr:MAG: hypothetical protein KF887_15125 [Paracoccaceae bacterium]